MSKSFEPKLLNQTNEPCCSLGFLFGSFIEFLHRALSLGATSSNTKRVCQTKNKKSEKDRYQTVSAFSSHRFSHWLYRRFRCRFHCRFWHRTQSTRLFSLALFLLHFASDGVYFGPNAAESELWLVCQEALLTSGNHKRQSANIVIHCYCLPVCAAILFTLPSCSFASYSFSFRHL